VAHEAELGDFVHTDLVRTTLLAVTHLPALFGGDALAPAVVDHRGRLAGIAFRLDALALNLGVIAVEARYAPTCSATSF